MKVTRTKVIIVRDSDDVKSDEYHTDEQWRSQPDNLLPLCKIPSYYHYSFLYKLIVFTVSEL